MGITASFPTIEGGEVNTNYGAPSPSFDFSTSYAFDPSDTNAFGVPVSVSYDGENKRRQLRW